MNQKLREQFEQETGKPKEVTEPVFAHSVTIINRDYVFWLEDKFTKLVTDIEALIAKADGW